MGQFSMVIYTPPGSHLSGNQHAPRLGEGFEIEIADELTDNCAHDSTLLPDGER